MRLVEEAATADSVRVRLAVPSGLTALITQHLERLRRDHADAWLELLSGSRPVNLKKDEAELALRLGPVADEDLVAQKMAEAGWSLYAAEAYLANHPAPSDPRQLSGHETIGYDPRLAQVPGAKWLEAHAAHANVVLRRREMSDMVAAATTVLGLVVLPCVLGETTPVLRRLTDESLGTQALSLVYRPQMLRVVPVRNVINFVAAVLREHAGLISGTALRSTTHSGNSSKARSVSPRPLKRGSVRSLNKARLQYPWAQEISGRALLHPSNCTQ